MTDNPDLTMVAREMLAGDLATLVDRLRASLDELRNSQGMPEASGGEERIEVGFNCLTASILFAHDAADAIESALRTPSDGYARGVEDAAKVAGQVAEHAERCVRDYDHYSGPELAGRGVAKTQGETARAIESAIRKLGGGAT